MSSFKKMYLLSEEKLNKYKDKNDENPYEIVRSPYLKSANKLDSDMKEILESNLEDNEKAKLYTNALQRYLLLRFKYLKPQEDLEVNEILSTNTTKTRKKLKTKNLHKKTKKLKKSLKYPVTPLSNLNVIASSSNKKSKNAIKRKMTESLSSPFNPTLRAKRRANIDAKIRLKNIIQDEHSKIPSWEKF